MDEMITFETAGKILFGNGCIEQIGGIVKRLQSKKVIIVTDKGLVRMGLLNRLTMNLSDVKYSVFDDVEATPGLETIRKATRFAKEEGADLVIGFGGGSSMDAAKAASVMVTNDGDIKDYLGRNTIGKPGLKKILIPTTAGTGSEVTIFSVLAERGGETAVLTGIADPHLLPDAAVIDPSLTLGMPTSLTANTGIDAFSHAAESYLNIRSNFQTEPLALASIRLLASNLDRAVTSGNDLTARYHVSAGSVLAGMSLSQTGGGLAHALAETIQIPYELPHGTAIAVLLPHVMSFNIPANPFKYAEMAKAMGEQPEGLSQNGLASKSVERLIAMIERFRMPRSLSELGIQKKDIPRIAHLTTEIAPSLLKVNPRSPTEKDLSDILYTAFD